LHGVRLSLTWQSNALEKTIQASKGFEWANFERFTILAAEVDGSTARQAQVLKRDLSWLNDRIAEVKAHRPGFSADPWTRTPNGSAPELNTTLIGSRSALTEMLKRVT
jgi:hypothetical protein